MPAFRRATTPTFKVTPVGYSASVLGTPHLALNQDMLHVELETTLDGDTVVGTLSYPDSLRFVAGVKTTLQCVWVNGDSVIAFPAHELDVLETHYEFEYVEETTQETQEE